jgi:hypothetical protein
VTPFVTQQSKQAQSTKSMHPMSKNAFAALSQLACPVCIDPNRPPAQWIYAVDDAWLHFGCDGLNEGSLFENIATTASSASSPINIGDAKIILAREITAIQSSTPSLSGSTQASFNDKKHPDQIPAETLLDFISQHPDQNYGICFCTFEYFWEHVETINHPQNAVFFDIRHQLMESDHNSDLKTQWGKALAATKVFPKPEWNSLGIQIYFAFKLGLHPKAPECKIDHNHLLILSSNLFGSESENGKTDKDRANSLLSFSAIQTAIWKIAAEVRKAITEGKNGDPKLAGLLDRKGTDYTFIPMPKHKLDDLFETALAIFHNSFRKAAGWDFKLERLRLDMDSLWKNPNYHENWGHIGATSSKLNELKSSSWLPSDANIRYEDVRGVYLAQWRIEHGIFVKTFDDFLRHATDFGTVDFESFPEGLANARLELPTRPGLLAMLAMADFLRALAEAKTGEGQKQPKVSWAMDREIKLTIKLTGANEELKKLSKNLFDGGGSPGGAAATMRQYVNSQIAMLDYPLKNPSPVKLGDISCNEQSLRNELLMTTDYHHVHPQRTFPQFYNDEIIFWFKSAEPRQAGA